MHGLQPTVLQSFTKRPPLRRPSSWWLSLSVPPEPRTTCQSSSWHTTSYLTNHTSQVTWNGSLSKPCFLGTAVAQGFSYHYKTSPNCSSHFPHPAPTPMLQRASQNIWQTSPLGQMRITSNSTSEKLNSSLSRGKTALTWTCQSLLRMSQYCLRRWQGTRA